jgi:hypothetical protein
VVIWDAILAAQDVRADYLGARIGSEPQRKTQQRSNGDHRPYPAPEIS